MTTAKTTGRNFSLFFSPYFLLFFYPTLLYTLIYERHDHYSCVNGGEWGKRRDNKSKIEMGKGA